MHCINPLHDLLEVCEGESIDLEVTLSELEAEVIWLHNGSLLRESMWISTSSNGYQRKLTIYSSTQKDEGLYACVLLDKNNPNVTVLTLCNVTIHKRKKPSLKEKAFEVLKAYQKLAWSMEESVLEHIALVICLATLLYVWCMYFCLELLQEDFPEAFEKKF